MVNSKKRSREDDSEDGSSSDQPPRKVLRDESSSDKSSNDKSSNDIPPSRYVYFVGAPNQLPAKDLQQHFQEKGMKQIEEIILGLNKEGETFGRGVLVYDTVESATSSLKQFQKTPVILSEHRVHVTFSKIDGPILTNSSNPFLIFQSIEKALETPAKFFFPVDKGREKSATAALIFKFGDTST